MTDDDLVELVRGTIVDEASPGSNTVAMYYSSPGVLSTIPYEGIARAVVAVVSALREAGRLLPEGVTVTEPSVPRFMYVHAEMPNGTTVTLPLRSLRVETQPGHSLYVWAVVDDASELVDWARGQFADAPDPLP